MGGQGMSRKVRKAWGVLLFPPSNQKATFRALRVARGKKTRIVALTVRLFVAAAFAVSQPVIAEPTPQISVSSRDSVFAALQDFVRTQHVVSLNFAEAPKAEQPSAAPDPYAVLRDFVRVADASGTVPLPVQAQGQPPDDAIHAGLRGATKANGDAYSILNKFVQDGDGANALLGPAQGAAPDDAIHAKLRRPGSGGDVYGADASGQPAPDDAIHARLKASFSDASGQWAPDDAIHARLKASFSDVSGQAPDDAIHAGLKTSFSDGSGSDGSGQAAPDGAIHAGLKASFSDGSDDYAALRDYAAGNAVAKVAVKPMVVATAAAAPKAKKPAAEAAESGPATYVGSAACIRCHRDQYGTFEQTLMGQIFLHHPRDAQEREGCESCHGPGSKHVRTKAPEDIISFAKDSPLPVEDRNAICLSCHERGDRTYWDGSVHQTRNLACTTCHQVMEKVSVKFQLAKATEPEVCFQCHKDIRAKMVNSSHMPLLNGSITCSSCHNPHGSATGGLLREASINETCYKCHADKRGPFLWEHEPVRDSCLNCHDPHGSVFEYMLTIQRPRLCQSCHMGPGHGNPGNPMTQFAVNRSCQNCHTFIHGSNSPAGELFQR
jgi:DmsE family decaheme c-type cytochrome